MANGKIVLIWIVYHVLNKCCSGTGFMGNLCSFCICVLLCGKVEFGMRKWELLFLLGSLIGCSQPEKSTTEQLPEENKPLVETKSKEDQSADSPSHSQNLCEMFIRSSAKTTTLTKNPRSVRLAAQDICHVDEHLRSSEFRTVQTNAKFDETCRV